MTENGTERNQVAVYIDFDNIVMSRYDELHGRTSFRDDGANKRNPEGFIRQRLQEANVDIDAIMEFASSFGTVAVSRAYADWSSPVHVNYAGALLKSSVDLVQMFPVNSSKNGADIRLAIDVIDDISRFGHLTHVLIVAGDSDYMSLAQRCKRLGRRVIGVGAAKSVGQYFKSACDEYRFYGNLPAVRASHPEATLATTDRPRAPKAAVGLMLRSFNLLVANTADEWVGIGPLKQQMLRLDATFDENDLGFKNFTDFLRSMSNIIEIGKGGSGRLLGRYATSQPQPATADEPGIAKGAGISGAEPDGHSAATGQGPKDGASPDPAAPAPETAAPASVHEPEPEPGAAPQGAALTDTIMAASAEETDPKTEAIYSALSLPSGPGGAKWETDCIAAIRVAWQMLERAEADPDSEPLTGLPNREVLTELGGDMPSFTQRRAVHVVFGLMPWNGRDSDYVMHANPEFRHLEDAQLLELLRQSVASRAQHKLYPNPVTADDVAAAIYEDQLPTVGAKQAFARALALPTKQAMGETLRPCLLPAPVLWDLAAATVAIPDDVPLGSVDALAEELAGPLREIERDPGSVPMSEAYTALTGARVIAVDPGPGPGRNPFKAPVNCFAGAETEKVVAAVLADWVRQLRRAGQVHEAEPMWLESLYRLVLPDRYRIEWRDWVRKHL